MRKILHKSLLLVAIMVLSLLLVTGCGPEGDDGAGKPKIIVSSKNFTEQLIVGNMVGLLMEDAGYPVDYKLRLGGTGLIHEALVNGEINVYIEYTGTALTVMLKEDPLSDPDRYMKGLKKRIKKNGTWSGWSPGVLTTPTL